MFAMLMGALVFWVSSASAEEVQAEKYPSLQAAIDANPGRRIRVPHGKHLFTRALRITGEGTVLCGEGTLVQQNADGPVLLIEDASDVRIESLTFTRDREQHGTADGVLCRNSSGITLNSVRVLDNRSNAAGIRIEQCENVTVRDSWVINYKRISIDDRTQNELLGYAFHCIDGSGIVVNRSRGTSILDCRIIERALIPTPEMVAKYRLGMLTEGRNPTRLGTLGKRAVDGDRVNNWHQGSAIVVTGPMESRRTILRGNHIENAAQAVDLHGDQVICTNNIIHRCLIGLKATHGCRNVILTGNLIAGVDLWGIVVNPGAASSKAKAAGDGEPAVGENVDAGLLISNNVISDFGEGNEYWNWGGRHEDRGSSYAIAFLAAQLETNPPLRDVLVQGNLVYDSQRDAAENARARPKYRYAVYVEPSQPPAEGLRFVGNLWHPGSSGISNIELHEVPATGRAE
ncbi:MAG: NosD domain-containing protein [Planctomycetota bacterium]